MPYTAIDGDISEFFESMMGVTLNFRTDELRTYLLNVGHSESDIVLAIGRWQENYLQQIDPGWETFGLTSAGKAAVEELRDGL